MLSHDLPAGGHGRLDTGGGFILLSGLSVEWNGLEVGRKSCANSVRERRGEMKVNMLVGYEEMGTCFEVSACTLRETFYLIPR
jgi:hypothetical protein